VNEGSKYPITGGEEKAIYCDKGYCARFGEDGNELMIWSDSNNKDESSCYCLDSYNLPAGKGSRFPSMNGGKFDFQVKQFEVYSVMVRININIIYRNNERKDI
jgi:hypothetical protein